MGQLSHSPGVGQLSHSPGVGQNSHWARGWASSLIALTTEEVDKVTHTCSQKLFDRKNEIIEKSMVLLEKTQEEVGKIKRRLKFDVSPGFDKTSPKDIL